MRSVLAMVFLCVSVKPFSAETGMSAPKKSLNSDPAAEVGDREEGSLVTAAKSYLFDSTGTLPTLFLVTAPEDLWDASQGIYANPEERGDEWERPVSIEYIHPGSPTLQIDAGIRIHGNFSRTFDKKSFRLCFSSDYGPSRFRGPLFPNQGTESFKRLVLNAGANDSGVDVRPEWATGWSLIRDPVMNELFRQSGQPVICQSPVRVYLNSEPWGIYWLKERIDRFFVEDRFGYKDFDLLKRDSGIEVLEGNDSSWTFLDNYVETNDLRDPDVYETVCSTIDLDNLIDHYIIEMWGACYDWPHNNVYEIRPRTAEGRFKWIAWDTDYSLNNPNYIGPDANLYPHVSGNHVLGHDWSTNLFRNLLENRRFQTRFVNRVAGLLNTVLSPENTVEVIREFQGQLASDISFETDRWGLKREDWEKNLAGIIHFAQHRAEFFRQQTEEFFDLSGTYELRVEDPIGEGTIRIGRVIVDSFPWTGTYFRNTPIPVAALPDPGYELARWEGAVGFPPLPLVNLSSTTDRTVRPAFRSIGSRPEPNDVIINEYWNDDDGTEYDSLGNRPVSGDWVELLVTRPDGVDLRNWRLTNNDTNEERDPSNPLSGSLVFPPIPELSFLPCGTVLLIVAETSGDNPSHFEYDYLDPSDGNLIFYANGGNLVTDLDNGFQISSRNDALALLAPGDSAGFGDDIGVDFIAEGATTTPESFGISADGVIFTNPFQGIGDDDGAAFTVSASGTYSNDNGSAGDADGEPGPGGWIVDPSAAVTGRTFPTPGRLNPGQQLSAQPRLDVDRSGDVDVLDLLFILGKFREPALPFEGDLNLNGTVDSLDYFLFASRLLVSDQAK